MMKYILMTLIPWVLLAAPKEPLSLTLSAGMHTVDVAWTDDATSETGYKIYRDDVLIYITEVNSSSYHDSDLEANHTYEYTIKATDDEEVASAGAFFMQALTDNKAHVISHNKKKLMWVNEYDHDKHACLAIHANRESQYDASVTFCNQLDFAGFNDWRDPNAAELSDFILESNAENIEVGYLAPCQSLLAREAGNGYETAVTTKYDQRRTLGAQREFVPYQYNIGLRCVRDTE
jgi:hypothetical protein